MNSVLAYPGRFGKKCLWNKFVVVNFLLSNSWRETPLCWVIVRNLHHCLVARHVPLRAVTPHSVSWTKNIHRCYMRTSRSRPAASRWYFTLASSVADFELRQIMQQILHHRIRWDFNVIGVGIDYWFLNKFLKLSSCLVVMLSVTAWLQVAHLLL